MLAPIAAVLLAFGAYHTPSMVTAEQTFLAQPPDIRVQDIQAANVTAKSPTVSAVGW